MMKKIKVIISWSSGKDSTLVLCRLLEDPRYEVVGLYTTYVGEEVPFQATPLSVVEKQAQLLNLPLVLIALPEIFPPNEIYQQSVVDGLKQSQIDFDAVAFGDMFCNGIADYRRSYIEPVGWLCVFPLLGESSSKLAAEIVSRGIKTRLITVDTSQLDSQYCGQWYNDELVKSLPDSADPCGEDGEFHTLVVDAPCFVEPLQLHWLNIERQPRFHYLRYQLVNNR